MTAYLHTLVRQITRLAYLTLVCFAMPPSAVAKGLPQTVGQDAIQLALEIESKQLYLNENWINDQLASENLPAEKRLRLMRTMITNTIFNVGDTDLKDQITNYRQYAQKKGTTQDKALGQLFEALLKSYDAELGPASQGNIEKTMSNFYNDEEWVVRHRAYYITSLVYSYTSNKAVALQFAQDALALIPERDTDYTLEARILTTTNIAYLHNLLGNPELSIEAVKQEMALKQEIDEPVDGINILYNLIYAFSTWRDHASTKSLVEILLRIENESGSDFPGIAEFRASGVYNELGEFNKAYQYATIALEKLDRRSVQEAAELNRIVALAGLGRVSEARTALSAFYNDVPEDRRVSGSAEKKILHIQALFALAVGDNIKAQELFNQRQDSSVQSILTKNNGETSKMLASLQNTKDRQDERESALKRESQLKQLALDRQKRVIWLLMAVAVILTALTFGAIAFARYRAKAAQKMSLAAQKARAGEKAKSEFLAIMSHELRTPLNGILGMADILSRTAPTEALRNKNNVILQSGNELLSLVENIFDMTLLENNDIELDPVETDVHDLINQKCRVWRPSIESADVLFTVHIDPNVPQFFVLDRTRAGQCLSHLLSNAAKFTMAGRVHVHVTAVQPAIGSSRGPELKIIVADTGVGISDEAMGRLFQPFVQADSSMTRQHGGAGLGLAITRSLARLMGGDLVVVSRDGRGSEFSLSLYGEHQAKSAVLAQKGMRSSPITSDTHKTPKNLSDIVSVQGKRFLVVEDDQACQDVVKSLLEPTGSHVTCAYNGQEALTALSVSPFDFVIMDIRMPGMDGVTAVRRIRQSGQPHRNIPIIALTADPASETNTKCMVAGVDIFLTKPVRAEDFYRAIDTVSRKTKALTAQSLSKHISEKRHSA